jgi:multicomponent Na+:H+ antiporter subunit A
MVLLPAVLAMLLAAAAVPVLAPRLGRSAGYPLAVVFLAVAGLLLSAAPQVLRGGEVVEQYPWVPSLDITLTLRLDGLALLFTMLVLGVGALVMSYTPRYLTPGDHTRLFGILTLFAGAMLGLVLAGDLVLLVLFWEVTTVSSFLLIAGQGTVGARPATRALVVTGTGGLALLGAVVLLATAVGSTDVATVIEQAPQVLTPHQEFAAAALIVVAAFTKSAQLPFHFWLPDAMVAITPVSAYLHAATLVKAGIYLLLRTSPMFADEPAWHLVLMTVGLATAIVGALLALRQYDLKALLAYSTVSQLGFIVSLVGIGTPASLGAATLLTTAHALFKATLFMLVGIIDREAGSRDVRELSGLWRVMPVTAVLTGLAAMSMAGVPPMVGFVSKEESFYAFIGASDAAWTGSIEWVGVATGVVAVLAAALTLAYSMRILVGAFAGPVRQPDLYEPAASFLAPAAVPAVLGLLLGLFPWVLNPLVNRAMTDTGVEAADADLALWHGFTPALAMSVVAISLGLAIHAAHGRYDHLLDRRTNPVAQSLFDAAWDRTLAAGARVGRPAHDPRPAAQLAGAAALLAAVLAGGLWLVTPVGPVLPGTARGADWVVLALLVPTVLAMATIRSAIGALVLVGVVGFTVSVWLLLLGAPDVALTLLLVEILTVVVAVPVLRRRPDLLPRAPGPVGTIASAATAIVVGLLAAAAVWLLTGRRSTSRVADYLLVEAEADTGGANVVNTVLVDYRGLDTFGEIAVLVAAALGLIVLLGHRRPATVAWFSPGEVPVLRAGAAVVVPVLVVVAVVLFWRGHDLPGGGFIAGLVLGLAVVVVRLVGWTLRLPRPATLLAAGLGTASLTGLLGLVGAGSFLEPMKVAVPWSSDGLTSSLLFDLGVVLVVLGLVAAAVERLEATDDEADDEQSPRDPATAGRLP